MVKSGLKTLIILSFSWSLLTASDGIDTLHLRISPEKYFDGLQWTYEGREIDAQQLSDILEKNTASHELAIEAIRYAHNEKRSIHYAAIFGIPLVVLGVWIIGAVTSMGGIQPPPEYLLYTSYPIGAIVISCEISGIVYLFKAHYKYINAIKEFNKN